MGELLSAPLTGGEARRVAAFQRDVGLLPKYKSYAIKASSPLGYSVFFQEPGQGFSFQQHREHKVEIFHVLDTSPGAFALICSLEDWTAHYDPQDFSRWLEGSDHPHYEKWRIPLSPGDVLCLERPGIVHTVIGCTLEEFATVSTDMVDRLHDQNAGASIPESYCRDRAQHLLRSTPSPSASQIITSPKERRPIERQPFPGGDLTTLGQVPGLRATRIRLEGQRQSPMQKSEDQALVLFASRGDASLLLGTAEEFGRQDPPPVDLPKGTVAMIPPGMSWKVASLTTDVEISVHSIPPEVALMRNFDSGA
ncbi:MAG TPA: hypothetical protein VN851_23995 [Thermoanaerobaculia bacterium]|nr:hypothetical protein [Thermoanaerobaculia bacterium]